jgi:HEAT repeat protein
VEALNDLLKRLKSADEEERRLAVSALSGFPFNEIKSLAVAALGDESWRVRKEAVDLILSVSPGDELAKELISLLTVQGNAGLRNSVVEVLQAVGEKMIPLLVEHLANEDPGIRKFIVDIMGGIGSASSIPHLTGALSDEDSNVAAAAAESLGLIGDPSSLPSLLEKLDRDDLLIRYAILEALVKIGSPVPLDAITPLAGDPLLKKALFECLGVIGDMGSISLLINGLGDRARNVREAALTALDTIRLRPASVEFTNQISASLKALSGSETVEYLMAMRESSDRKVRSAAIAILGIVGDMRALDVLLKGYGDETVQQESLEALRVTGKAAGPFLAERFASGDEEGRCVIVHLSGELRLPECRSIISEGLGDSSPMVRALAAEAVGKAGMIEFIPILVKLINDENPEVRHRGTAALVKLAALSRESVADSAIHLAESDNPDCRLQAVRLFGALAEINHLRFLSKDEDFLVRREAIATLGELRAPETAGILFMALADEETDVRLAAAAALGWSGFTDESGYLQLALEDSSQRVQAAVIKSLGLRHELLSFDRIEQFAGSSSGMLKIAAMNALTQIDPVRASGVLRKVSGDVDEEVARVALHLLSLISERY